MKRLRKKFGSGICFFHSGEYGSLYMRPHHHAIIFGMDFNDKELISRGSSSRFYYSSTLATLWPFGFSSIGQVTEQSCAYVARYVLKKVNGKEAKSYYGHLKPEYITMSRKPGIAHDWILQYKDDVYPHDYVVLSKGIKARPSAYYDKIYDLMDNNSLQLIKNNRIEQIKNNSDYDNPERLAVKEKVQQLRTKKLVRNLEQVL